MKSIKKFNFIILAVSLVLASCQTKTTAPKVKEAAPEVVKVEEVTPKFTEINAEFKSQITDVYQAYNQLKDALVASDSALAITATSSVLSYLKKVDMALLKQAEAHQVLMTQKPLLIIQLNKVVYAKTLAEQRAAFLKISDGVINLIENFGISQKVMVQFCPMADDFKGGYWLSTDAAIKNPYFGSKMLTCGSTKKIIN